jgi:hypothetical protein
MALYQYAQASGPSAGFSLLSVVGNYVIIAAFETITHGTGNFPSLSVTDSAGNSYTHITGASFTSVQIQVQLFGAVLTHVPVGHLNLNVIKNGGDTDLAFSVAAAEFSGVGGADSSSIDSGLHGGLSVTLGQQWPNELVVLAYYGNVASGGSTGLTIAGVGSPYNPTFLYGTSAAASAHGTGGGGSWGVLVGASFLAAASDLGTITTTETLSSSVSLIPNQIVAANGIASTASVGTPSVPAFTISCSGITRTARAGTPSLTVLLIINAIGISTAHVGLPLIVTAVLNMLGVAPTSGVGLPYFSFSPNLGLPVSTRHNTLITDDITSPTIPGLPEVVSQNPSFNASIKNFDAALQAFLEQLDTLLIKPRFMQLSSDLINELAVEFRPPAYDQGGVTWQSLPLWQRQAMIATACYDNAHLGTPASVQKLVNQIFGNAVVQEWWEYGGQPYRFRVLIPGSSHNISQSVILNAAILATKPLSRWPDTPGVLLGAPPVGSGARTYVGAAFFQLRHRKYNKVTITIPGG